MKHHMSVSDSIYVELPSLADGRVFFDIETISSSSDEDRQYLHDHMKPPGTIKDPAKRDAWIDSDKHHEASDKAMKDTVFDGLFGEVVSIAWGHFDGEGYYCNHSVTREGADDNEAEMIAEFFNFLLSYRPRTPVLVGYNIIGFDIKFLQKRALVLGLELPRSPVWPRDIKPWSKSVEDLMIMVDDDRYKFVSMDKLCYALGIEGKKGMDGSMVGDMWQLGEYGIIDEYCQDDVSRTRDLWLRLVRAGFIR